MAQHDYTIANQGFPAFRSDLNDALAAIVSNNSGATEPTTMFAHQIWVDTAANPSILKIRNADNDAWITIGSIDQTGDTFTLVNLRTSGPVVFNDAGADVDFRVEGDTDANLLFVDAGNDRVGIGTSSPSEKMHIAESSSGAVVNARIENTNTNANSDAGLELSTANGIWEVRAGRSTGALQFFAPGSTERMRIDSSGNVGIGTSSPKLNGNTGTFLSVIGTNASGWLELGTTSQTDGIGGSLTFNNTNIAGSDKRTAQIGAGRSGADNTAYLGFITNNAGTLAERMRITSGGYLKANNNGTYINSTGTYHEISQTAAGSTNLITYASSGSFSSAVLFARGLRGANSAYSLFAADSGDGADQEFNLRGDGNGYADGTWNNNGADYAEFFESANGQALTLGATVVLDGNKVREATDQDPASAIIGVVRPKEPSKASMVVGNTAWNKWANKYLTDDFDRYIMEDHEVVEWEEQVLETEAIDAVVDEEGNEVSPAQEATYKTVPHSYESHNIPTGITVPVDATRKTHDEKGNKFQHYKLNPAWNPDSEYVNRENRPEWNIIGLLGQVKILKGQPMGERWVKMRDISDTVEEWFIR